MRPDGQAGCSNRRLPKAAAPVTIHDGISGATNRPVRQLRPGSRRDAAPAGKADPPHASCQRLPRQAWVHGGRGRNRHPLRPLATGTGRQASKDFPFHDQWNGKRYATKQVRPVFVEDPDEIVVITVYTYFF